MAKTEFLQIRLSPDDRDRIWRVAGADHLDPSTWARRIILQAIETWEKAQEEHGLSPSSGLQAPDRQQD